MHRWLAAALLFCAALRCGGLTTRRTAPLRSVAVAPTNTDLPLRITAPGRVVAIGDVHGDVEAFRATLRACDLIDDEGRWSGKDACLVQCGDMLDRGLHEAECWSLLERLGPEAKRAGGRVARLVGNHEVMNVCGIAGNYVHASQRNAFGPDRAEAWAPGSQIACALAADCYAAVIVNDSCFVHAHLPMDATMDSLEALNEATRRWLRGEPCDEDDCALTAERRSYVVSRHNVMGEDLPYALSPYADADLSPVWGRALGGRTVEACGQLANTLDRLNVKRVVVGHTPQSCGINAACNGRVWRVDTGMSAQVANGARQGLEIRDGACRIIGEDAENDEWYPILAMLDLQDERKRPAASCAVYYADDVVGDVSPLDRTENDNHWYDILDDQGTPLETVGKGGHGRGMPGDRVPMALGRGRFGQVYLGECEADGAEVAIKVIPSIAPRTARDTLAREARYLSALKSAPSVPNVRWSGSAQVFGQPAQVLVMDLLGESVESYRMHSPDQKLSIRGTLAIGRDLVSCLRKLSKANIVHNDIKPTNIAFGPSDSDTAERAFLVDFGSATEVGATNTRNDAAFRYGGGTPLFASLAAQEGRATTPADDLESLWYTLAFLAHGTLPWQWEEPEQSANIKREMFADECSIASTKGDCAVDAETICVTSHCRNTIDHWLDGTPDGDDALYDFWGEIMDLKDNPARPIDYGKTLGTLE